MNMTDRAHGFAAGLLILIVAGLAYANSFHAEFHFDDYTYIVNKPALRDITDWRAIYRALGHPSRFVAFYTFAVNYHFHDYNVFGYHLVNWFIHAGNGFLVWWMTLLFLRTPQLAGRLSTGREYGCALLTALIFTAHPLQTEAVTYIVQRFTSLATLFYLAAVVCYLRGRLRTGPGWRPEYVLFAVFTVLGMFTKQICFTIPFMVLWLEWCCFENRIGGWLRERRMILAVLIVLLLIIPSFFGFNAVNIVGRELPSRSHTGERLNAVRYALTQTRVIPTYLRLYFWPAGQTLDYDFPVSTDWREGKVIAGFLLLLLLAGGAVAARSRLPEITLGTGWFFVTIAVTSSIIPIPHVIFEHRVYLPSAGLAFISAWMLCRLVSRRNRLLAAAGMIVAVLTVLTYQRNAVWQTEATLWADIVRKAPAKVRAYNNLGMAALAEGRARESLSYFAEAIARNPGAGRVYNNRGLAYLALGDEDLALADFDRAIALFETSEDYRSGRYKPIWAQVYANRGNLRLERGDTDGGRRDLATALSIDPRHPAVLYRMGQLSEQDGDYDTAAGYYRRLLATDPRHPQAMIGLGFVSQYQGDDRQALQYFDQALALVPDNGEAHFFRALSRYNLGDRKGARDDMRDAQRMGFEAATPQLKAARETILNVD
ncbi:MAG: tetratricopeptide repeat protein [Candidatus Omnitrophica bacterium]|nr:tetratricopeptide repeat protein [Candidatus Omnitrophota bacterium]